MGVFDEVMAGLSPENRESIQACLDAWSATPIGKVVADNLQRETALPGDSMADLLEVFAKHWRSPEKGQWAVLEEQYKQTCWKHGLKCGNQSCSKQLPDYLWHARPKKILEKFFAEKGVKGKASEKLFQGFAGDDKKQWKNCEILTHLGHEHRIMWCSWDVGKPAAPVKLLSLFRAWVKFILCMGSTKLCYDAPFSSIGTADELKASLALEGEAYEGSMLAFAYPKFKVASPGPLKPTVADGALHPLFRVSNQEECGRAYSTAASKPCPEAVHKPIYLRDVVRARELL